MLHAVSQTESLPLKIWERFRIIVGEGDDLTTYDARVKDIINGGIIISEPSKIAGKILLRNDMHVTVQVNRPDAAYQFETTIRRQGKENSRSIVLAPPKKISRLQRRQFARIDLPIKVSYSELNRGVDWKNWRHGFKWYSSYAGNASAGGILLTLRQPIRKGSLLVMEIDFFKETGLPEQIIGIVGRSFKREGCLYVGVEFILKENFSQYFDKSEINRMPEQFMKFDRRIQDKLVTRLFHKQVEMRKRGLI